MNNVTKNLCLPRPQNEIYSKKESLQLELGHAGWRCITNPMTGVPLRITKVGRGRSESSSYKAKSRGDSSHQQMSGRVKEENIKASKVSSTSRNLDGKAGLSNKRVGGNSKVSNSQKRPPLLETRGYRKKADALVPEALSTGRSQNHSGKCCFYWNTTQEDSCLSLSADLQPPNRGPCWAIPEEAIWLGGLEM